MAQRFAAESKLPLTYSAENTRATLWRAIHSPLVFLVWQGEETLGGSILGGFDNDFTIEKAAYIIKFYVEKELRGLGVSRELLRAFESDMTQRGASVVFASSTVSLGTMNEKLYVNLFEKEGYNVFGHVLIRELQ